MWLVNLFPGLFIEIEVLFRYDNQKGFWPFIPPLPA